MIKVVICDDDIGVINVIVDCIMKEDKKAQQNSIIAKYTNPADLEYDISEGERFDIIFLDIEMGDKNGINVAAEIRKYDMVSKIIYVTSHEECVFDSFETNPLDFLKKPVDCDKLAKVYNRACLGIDNFETFEFFYKRKFTKILLKDIIMFYSNKRNVHIVIKGDAEHICNFKIDEIEEILIDKKGKFLRLSKSFLVNYTYIKEFQYDSITLYSGEIISISEAKRKEIRNFYMSMKG